MLHIILFILKIIGIVLVCILGLILLSILCALFVPVRYRIRVSREAGEGNPPVTAYVKITWLLHLVNILVRYPADVIVRVRFFLFTVFRIPGKDKKSKDSKTVRKKRGKNRRKGKKRQEDKEAEEGIENDGKQEESSEAQSINCAKDVNVRSEVIIGDDFTPFEMGTLEGEPSQEVLTETEAEEGELNGDIRFSLADKIRKCIEKIKRLIEKIKHTVDKIKAFFENIQYTIRNFCDKIKSVLDNIQYYREVLESDSFKRSMELCKGELGYVFRKLKPDKFEADLNVGMEDPAVTGQILAVYGMLYPLIGRQVRLVGDFESEDTHIEGELYIRGRIRTFTFLRVLIRIYKNKNIRTLIKLLKKEAV